MVVIRNDRILTGFNRSASPDKKECVRFDVEVLDDGDDSMLLRLYNMKVQGGYLNSESKKVGATWFPAYLVAGTLRAGVLDAIVRAGLPQRYPSVQWPPECLE